MIILVPLGFVFSKHKKSDAVKAVKDFCLMLKRQHLQHRIKRFRTDNGTDNGTEYMKLDGFFREEGIIHELTPPYHHEPLGIPERTIMTMVRSMDLKYKFLWPYSCSTAVYIKSRLPHATLNRPPHSHEVKNQTPYEIINGKKPTISHLQPFGVECYVHIPEEARPSGIKLQPRAVKGIFIKYTDSTKIFQVYIPEKHRVIRSGGVLFPNAPISERVLTKSNNLQPLPLPTLGHRPLPSTDSRPITEF